MQQQTPAGPGLPMVSVLVPTYQHAPYIEQCIESILMQRTSFPVEILIGEDESTDGTQEVCERLVAAHPDRIKLFQRSRKDVISIMGWATGRSNMLKLFASATGRYIALCEGDDYWTDPLKLQKQVDFLEAHPDFSLCFHPVVVKNTRQTGEPDGLIPEDKGKDVFTTEDVLGPWFIPTCSIVFRRRDPFILPSWLKHVMSADIPLLLLLSLEGKFKMLNEVMGVYRRHPGGMSRTHYGYDKVRGMAYIYELFNANTDFRFNDKVREAFVAEVKQHLPEVHKMARLEKRVMDLEHEIARNIPLHRKLYYFMWNHFPWLRGVLR